MTYNLSYDYCAIIMVGVLVFFYYVTPKYKSLQNRLFGWILICDLTSCAMDALSAGLLLPKYPEMILTNRLVLEIYQISQHALSPLYYIYMVLVVYKKDAYARLRKYWPVLIPGGIVEFVNITSIFTQWGFRYDENGYGRTNFYFVSWSVLAFYMILCLILIFKNKSRTGFLPKLAVLFYSVVSILSALVQFVVPSELVISFAATVAVFTMYMSLQNPTLLKEALEDAEESRKVAEEANEAKSNFLANMSHEIRTPMNAICGMTYLLESFDLKTDAREYLTTIQHASENLMSLINDILDFSKVDAGQMTLSETQYSTSGLLREIGGLVLADVPRERIVMDYVISPSVPKELRGDVTKLKQIIANLLSNAIKYTEQGEIKLELSAAPKENGKISLIIKVSDTGIGISKEDQTRIFAQFEQLDMAKNRKREGAGLGLALVKAFSELMNGYVKVESEVGKGSIFTAVVEQTVVEEVKKSSIDNLSKYVYVILERNPYSRKSIERTLNEINATYTIEDSFTKDAFEKFNGMKFCLVYNFEQYGQEVEAVDLSEIKGLRKIAMVDVFARIPEDCKDVHFARMPFSLLTLFDILSTVEVESIGKEEEKVYFKDTVKVAIVDDNKVNLKVTGAILKKFGITAQTMLSGYEILDEIDAGAQFDLIFMDHMMPDMDGVETVKRIRAMHKGNTANVPIVALTANAVQGVEQEYYEAGMNGALFKPVNVDDLKETLVKWLPASQRIEAPKE